MTILPIRQNSDTIALDWLSPNVVIEGCTFGAVKLSDNRIPTENDNPRIRHPTGISHVRRIDENMIVVAGMGHTVRKFLLSKALRD